MIKGLAFSHFAQSELCWCYVPPAPKQCSLCCDGHCFLPSDPVNRSRDSWYTVLSVSVHADDISPIREHTLGAQRGPSHVCFQRLFFFFFSLSNVIFQTAHSSTFTMGRADSAEGHPDTWAEWMTFRVQFSIFHHFFERHYSSRLNCAHFFARATTHTHTHRALFAGF